MRNVEQVTYVDVGGQAVRRSTELGEGVRGDQKWLNQVITGAEKIMFIAGGKLTKDCACQVDRAVFVKTIFGFHDEITNAGRTAAFSIRAGDRAMGIRSGILTRRDIEVISAVHLHVDVDDWEQSAEVKLIGDAKRHRGRKNVNGGF